MVRHDEIEGQHERLCAVVLAGGQSRRMGSNKALLEIEGTPMIRRVVDKARRMTDLVFISSNNAALYDFLGLPVVPDLFPGQGPLSGLHAAMMGTSRPLFLLLACDLPNLRIEVLRKIVAVAGEYDAVIPRGHDGRLHPACALYRRTCLPFLELQLASGVNMVTSLFEDAYLRVKWLDPDEGGFADSDLHNVNTPEDFAKLKR